MKTNKRTLFREVRTPKYRQRVVSNKKVYSRKKKHKEFDTQ